MTFTSGASVTTHTVVWSRLVFAQMAQGLVSLKFQHTSQLLIFSINSFRASMSSDTSFFPDFNKKNTNRSAVLSPTDGSLFNARMRLLIAGGYTLLFAAAEAGEATHI